MGEQEWFSSAVNGYTAAPTHTNMSSVTPVELEVELVELEVELEEELEVDNDGKEG